MFKNIFRFYWLYFIISMIVIIPGLFSLITHGVLPSIDFTGGTLLEVKVQKADNSLISSDEVTELLEKHLIDTSAVQSTSQGSWIIRSSELESTQKQQFMTELESMYPVVDEIRYETVGPILGRELIVKTLIAIVIVANVITFFLMRQFNELKFGISAVLAMLHDTLILVCAFSILGWWKGVEVDVLFVTALLTTLSFSVHDTIVVFHRIRELQSKHPQFSTQELASTAAIQTLSRSINNSLTIIIMLSALVLLGGETLRWFAVALLIGSITGTFSSTFVAVPLLLLWEDISNLSIFNSTVSVRDRILKRKKK